MPLTDVRNRSWRLARVPPGGWPAAADFLWVESDVPTPGPGQLLSQTIYLSMDPYQWVRRRNGVEQVGDVCHGRTVAQVLRSNIPGYEPGDFIFNTNGWQTFGLTGEGISTFRYMLPRKLDPTLAPISTALGVMGMLGLTAYAGLVLQCQPRAGETVVVSAAAGGVGQCVGQIARLLGARVVGIAGSDSKCAYVVDALGLDACVSHHSESFAADLQAACPDGVDVYFENVGGKVFDAVLPLLNPQARISLCGLISQYGNRNGDATKDWFRRGQSTFDRQSVQAHTLFVGDFVAEHQDAFLSTMSEWLRDGHVQYREHRIENLENAPIALAEMLSGGNFGKTLVVVQPEPISP